MFSKFGKVIKEAKSQIESVINADSEADYDDSPEESLGMLWEELESVNSCRHCLEPFAMPFLKRKHHCRQCGGVFCDNCCPKPKVDKTNKQCSKINNEKSGKGKLENATNIKVERVCFGCLHCETPSASIQLLIKNQLDIIDKKENRPNTTAKKALIKLQKAADKVVNNFGIEVNRLPPSIPVTLQRGKIYNDENQNTSTIHPQPPVAGYFEFSNKHAHEVCCIKLLHGGGNKKYEIPRPSYFAVPPGHSVSGLFNPEIELIELILLHNNPYPIRDDQRLIFDTRAKNVSSAQISDCAKVENFEEVAYFVIKSQHKNVILKFKGGESVVPRQGSSLVRVGLINYFANKRFAPGLIDYATNVEDSNIDLDFICST